MLYQAYMCQVRRHPGYHTQHGLQTIVYCAVVKVINPNNNARESRRSNEFVVVGVNGQWIIASPDVPVAETGTDFEEVHVQAKTSGGNSREN